MPSRLAIEAMPLDLARIRSEIPDVAHRVHLNNAGAGLMPQRVLDAMTDYVRREALIGGYEAADEAAPRLDGVYDSVARLNGAQRDEVALTENATVAWQMAFYSLAFRQGGRIFTARAEYAANFVAILQVAAVRAWIEVVPDADGVLDPHALERMIEDRVRLIAITWVPTNGGLVNPAAAMGRIARPQNIPYLRDACQAVDQIQVAATAIGCDILSTAGLKFLRGPRERLSLCPPQHSAGPRTAGDRSLRRSVMAADRYELRSDTRRFKTWEITTPLVWDWVSRSIMPWRSKWMRSSGVVANWRFVPPRAASNSYGLRHDLGPYPVAIVTCSIAGIDVAAVTAHLAGVGINVTASKPSSTLLDPLARRLPTVVHALPTITTPKMRSLG